MVRIVADAAALFRAAAEEFVQRAEAAVRERGSFAVALAGGSTPKGLYTLLAGDGAEGFKARVPWDRTHFFWGDERHVAPDHPESNYRMAHEAMLSHVAVPPEHIHRIKTENPDAGQAAEQYEQVLREFFRLQPGQWPRFDLVLLGMGPDGHTASLFPGTDAIHEQVRLVAAPWVQKFNTHRVTLTPPVLNHSAGVIFMVSGSDKAETLQAVLEGGYEPDRLPSQVVRPAEGDLLWLVDRAAAAKLRVES